MRLAARRMRAHLPLFAALFAITAVIAGFIGGIAGFVSSASVAGVREGYAAATGSDGSVRADVRLAGPDQDGAVRAAVAEAFGGAPVLVDRTLRSDPVTVGAPAAELDVSLAALDVRERATLDSGDWPSGADEALLSAAAATAAGLGPGDTVVLPGPREVTVSGTWTAVDPLDPYWFAEDLGAVLVVDEAVFDQTGVVPVARWTVRPDPVAIGPDALDRVSAGATGLRALLDADESVGTGNVVVSGGLAQWTDRLRGSIGAVAGVAPVPVILSAVIGLIALVELARLLVGVRVVETGLLRSRGASAARLARDAAGEAALAAVPGAAAGTAIAAVLGGTWSWHVAGVVAAAAVAAFALSAFLDARAPARRETAQDSGRGRRIASVGLVVLTVSAAALSAWQFLLYGSPVVGGRVDPIAVLAPALVLVAGALLGVLLFGIVTAALERALRRRGTLPWTLAARQVSRRIAVFTTPVLLVGLATGGLTVAAAYSATWATATATALDVGNGADVRAVTGEPAASFAAVEGVRAVSAVLTAELQLGDDPVALVSLPASAAESVLTTADGAIDTRRLATSLGTDTPSVVVPAGTERLTVEATAPTLLWIVDSDGDLAVLRPGDTDLPAGDGWRILAADVVVNAPASPYTYRIDGILADGSPLDLGDWRIAEEAQPLEGEAVLQGVGFVATLDIPRAGTVRLVPAGDQALPLVVSQSLADRGSLSVGDALTLRFEGSGREVSGTIADVVPAVPGTSNGLGVVADLPALLHGQLLASATVPEPDEVWIATANPSAVTGARVTTTDPRDSVLAAGRGALWIGSAGGLVLAVAAVSSIAGALLRGRTGELVVLRAVGLSAAEQAGSRRRELILVLGWSVVAGLAAGIVTSLLLVPALARSAVLDPPDALPTVLRVDALWGGTALAALILALVAVVAVYSARVARQARTLPAREEVR